MIMAEWLVMVMAKLSKSFFKFSMTWILAARPGAWVLSKLAKSLANNAIRVDDCETPSRN